VITPTEVSFICANHEISSGMEQRFGTTQALSMALKMLLPDKPFGALDALTRAKLQDELLAIFQNI